MNKLFKFFMYSALGMVSLVLGLIFVAKFIYGPDYMYQCDPPNNEGWIKVKNISRNSFIFLEDGSQVSLFPFGFSEDSKIFSEEEISRMLFNVSVDDLYLRKDVDGSWIVRVGNQFVCSLPQWFPKGQYGYYERELIDRIGFADITLPKEKRLTVILDETALIAHFEKAEQRGAINPNNPDLKQ